MAPPDCADPNLIAERAISDRLACVSVPELPLQLLLRQHPEWALYPAAVVAEDKPHAELLWVNELGRKHGVLPGQRFSTGLTLCRELRAGTVSRELIADGVDQLCTLLRRFSPHIEPSTHEPGIFWVDARGLRLLYASLAVWARGIQQGLNEAGFNAVVIAGFSRFFTYALARANRRPVQCFRDEASEKSAAMSVPLSRLGIDPRARDTLAKLGVHHVGAFMTLPEHGLLERFGPDLQALHALATGKTWTPLQPTPEPIPLLRRHLFDDGEHDVYRLLFVIKRELDALLRTLASQQQALLSLTLRCKLEHTALYLQTITPAAPTLDGPQLLDLVRLRLEASPPSAPMLEIEVEVVGTLATAEQLRLLSESIRRDLAAADRALARVRAELGPDAVCHAVLQEGHLPEACFRFQRLEHTRLPQANASAPLVAVRRLWLKPWSLPHTSQQTRIAGPFVTSGGWWNRQIQRDYYFIERVQHDARTQDHAQTPAPTHNELLYCFYDAERGRWMVHGAL